MQTSQRKVFTRATLDEAEQTLSTESMIVDRDAVNVTRASSKTSNWNVSGNAEISIPIAEGLSVGLGFGGGVSESVTNSATHVAEHVSETTAKSADTMRNLHRVEVTETSETVTETGQSRKITNPYADRSLLLKVFSLTKTYCVEFSFEQIRPTLLFRIEPISFDSVFVRNNGHFLDEHLVDRRLRIEVGEALAAAVYPSPLKASEELQKLAALALKYLFEEPNLFNVPQDQEALSKVGDIDPNSPEFTFDATPYDYSGLSEAIRDRFGITFTTLNFFYRLYHKEVAVGGDRSLLVPIALSIEHALAPIWTERADNDSVSNLLDMYHRTEAFRRLGGFLAMISGSIRPLVKPAESELRSFSATLRAEQVVQRVADHLKCHARFYTARYLEYLAEVTSGVTLQSFVERLIKQVVDPAFTPQAILSLFAPEQSFVDKLTIVVPGRSAYTPAIASTFLRSTGGAPPLPFGTMRVHTVRVPAEGTHIEAAAGACVLSGVTAPPPPHALSISLGDDPIQVQTANTGA